MAVSASSGRSELRPRRCEDPRERHAQERGGDVGPVVDVLACSTRPTGATHESHGVDVQQQDRRAELGRRDGIEDVGPSERQIERLGARGVLVKEVAEVSCRPMRRRDFEDHRRPPGYSSAAHPSRSQRRTPEAARRDTSTGVGRRAAPCRFAGRAFSPETVHRDGQSLRPRSWISSIL